MNDLFTLTTDERTLVQYVQRLLQRIAAVKNLRQALEKPDVSFSTEYERENIVSAIQKSLKKLAAEKNEERLINALKKLSPETILVLAQQNEKFENFCKCEALKSHWKKLITEIGVPTNPDFRWRVENNGNYPFDQWRGIICLLKYLDQNLGQDLRDWYCAKAAQFGCFYAQYVEIIALLGTLRADLRNSLLKKNIIAKALRAVELHGMPGWVLLATTFMSLAIFYKSQFAQTHDVMDKGVFEVYCRCASMFLGQARIFDAAQESEVSKRNAGVGYPFFMSFKIRCRNHEEYSSLENMEKTLTKISSYDEAEAIPQTAFFLKYSVNRQLNFAISPSPRPT